MTTRRMTNDEILAELGTDSPLNRARRELSEFVSWVRSLPPEGTSPFELRRREFETVSRIVEASGARHKGQDEMRKFCRKILVETGLRLRRQNEQEADQLLKALREAAAASVEEVAAVLERILSLEELAHDSPRPEGQE